MFSNEEINQIAVEYLVAKKARVAAKKKEDELYEKLKAMFVELNVKSKEFDDVVITEATQSKPNIKEFIDKNDTVFDYIVEKFPDRLNVAQSVVEEAIMAKYGKTKKEAIAMLENYTRPGEYSLRVTEKD